jgi:hypothetical protein
MKAGRGLAKLLDFARRWRTSGKAEVLLKHQHTQVITLIGVLGFLVVGNASAQTLPNPAPAVPAATAPATDEATEVNKELSNPISSIWALQIQENTFFIHPGIEDKSSRNSVTSSSSRCCRWL